MSGWPVSTRSKRGAAARVAEPLDRRLAGTVDVGPMVDPQDVDPMRSFIELVDDPVGSPAGRPEPMQLTVKRVSDSFRLVDERTQQEFHDSGGSFLGQSNQRSIGRRSHQELPSTAAHVPRR